MTIRSAGGVWLVAGMVSLTAACGGDAGKDQPKAGAKAVAESTAAPENPLGAGVTVDTQRIEDSTVAAMYMVHDSADQAAPVTAPAP